MVADIADSTNKPLNFLNIVNARQSNNVLNGNNGFFGVVISNPCNVTLRDGFIP